MPAKPIYEELEKRVKELEETADERAASKKQLKFLSLAVDQGSEGIAVVDLDGNLEYLNNAFAKMHGYSAEELAGKNLSIFHAPEQIPSVKAANLEIKKTGSFKGEIWHVKRDGTVFPTLMHNSLIRDDAGKPIGIMGTLRDITDIKQTDEVLRESERSLAEAQRLAGIGSWEWDTGTDTVIWSKELYNISGRDPNKFAPIFAEHPSLFTPESFKRLDIAVRTALDKGTQYDLDLEMIRTDGVILQIRARGETMYNSAGHIIGLRGTVQDITERKQMEDTLKKNEQELKSIFRAAPTGIGAVRDRFLYQVNDRFCEITGYSKDELIGQNAKIIYSTAYISHENKKKWGQTRKSSMD
ncbi:PAS domain S-box protein [Desulfobacula sp.]|uniref:PAS domain-containing protein n=1 Tax=Desulfobacula sp. TaxID=2593537 RepID=UPI002626A5B8|nr:PAS domain S-box protein [Desulfobacula sp.]